MRKSLFRLQHPSPSSLKSYTITHPYGSARINFCSNCGSTVYKDSEDPSFAGLDLVIVQGATLDALEQWEWEKASGDLETFQQSAAKAGAGKMPLTPESSQDGGEEVADVDAERGGESMRGGEKAVLEAGPAPVQWQGCGCGCC